MKESSQLEQRSHDWLQARCGYPSGSGFKHIMARTKAGKPTAARHTYLMDKVTERLTGQPVQHFVTAAMQWGIDNEGYARDAYEAATGRTVAPMGFVRHPSIVCGVSPDGIVDMEGLLEIKCPNSATHLETIREGMDAEHMAQLQGGMWVCNLKWADFVSYDPRLPKPYHLYIQRVERDQVYIDALEDAVHDFLIDLDTALADIKTRIEESRK